MYNDIFFGLSQCKPSAVFDHGMLIDVVSLLKFGTLSPESKGEAFLNGERLPNSTTSEPLPDSLTDSTCTLPLCNNLLRIFCRRDGCAGQYQGKKGFRGWQTLKSRTDSIHFVDCRNPSKHGKCLCDGQGGVLTSNIRRSMDDDYEAGTQNMVRHLATKYSSPKQNRKSRYTKMNRDELYQDLKSQKKGSAAKFSGGVEKGMFAASRYIYIYILSRRCI